MSALIGLGMLAQGLAGYGNFKQQQRDNERQDKLDAAQAARDAMAAERQTWDRETADARRRDLESRDAVNSAIGKAGKAGTIEDGGVVSYTGADGAQKAAYQPDLQTAQFAAEQQRLEEGQSSTPPATPSAPKAEKASSVRTLDGGRKLFTGLTAASDAKKFADENPTTSYSRQRYLSDKFAESDSEYGRQRADEFFKRMKTLKDEGVNAALANFDADRGDEGIAAFQSVGEWKFPAGTKPRAVGYEGKDPVTGAKKTLYRIVDEDSGNTLVGNVHQAAYNYLLGPEKRATIEATTARTDAEERTRAEAARESAFARVEAARIAADARRETSAENNETRRLLAGVRGGAGGAGGDGAGGKAGKLEDALRATTKAIMDAVKESAESKTLNADQLIGVQATARELVVNAMARNQQLDPHVAGKVALTAVLKPESVKPSYDSTTGAFNSTVAYNGNTFPVGRLDPAAMSEGQLKGVAKSFVSKLSAADKADYIKAAAGDAPTLAKINADIAAAHGKEWSDRFAAANGGRRPTKEQVDASIARTKAIAQQNISLVDTSGAVEQDKKQREAEGKRDTQAAAQKAIGTPESIMALPPGEAQRIYAQYSQYTNAFQRDALQTKMARDRRNLAVGGLRQP